MSAFTFYGACISFLLGVLFATVFDLYLWFTLAVLIITLGALVLISLRAINLPLFAKHFPIFMLALSIGLICFNLITPSSDITLNSLTGQEIYVSGVVDEEVRASNNSSTLVVQVDELRRGSRTVKVDSKMRITTPLYNSFGYGDRLSISGQLDTAEEFETETGRVFDYKNFLAKDGIFYTMFYPEIEKLAENEGNPVFSVLLDLKYTLMSSIIRVLSDPEAALANGILLGVEQSLGQDLEEAFRNTGLIHIVVLSGYNVTLVAVAVMYVLKHMRVGLRTRSAVGIGGIIAFAVLVGLGATVVRASIMAALVVITHAIGQRAHMLRALFLAVVIMVLFNPMILVFDPSFQLSAVATLGLVIASPILERVFTFIPTVGGLREIITATVSTQLAVLPMLVYMVGSLSIVSVLVNALTLPAVGPAMLFSFLAGLVGVFSRTLALPFTVLAYVFLGYILFIVNAFNNLPFSHITVPPIPIWVPVFMYVVLGAIMVWFYRCGSYKLGMPSLTDRLS